MGSYLALVVKGSARIRSCFRLVVGRDECQSRSLGHTSQNTIKYEITVVQSNAYT